MPAMIVLGDRTDHGGEVIEASGVTDTQRKGIARVGDKVYCPKNGHGTAVITTGDPTMIIDGKAVAYHGCKTSCGATLISAQSITTVNTGGGGSSASASQAAGAISATQSTLAFAFDEQAQLSANSGLAWFIETSDGRTMSSAIDSDGLLPRVDTFSEGQYTIYWGDEAIAKMHGAAE